MHVWIFNAYFSSRAHSSVFLVLFCILRAVPYSWKGLGICALNLAQFLASTLRSACMRRNWTRKTAMFAIEEIQNRRAIFASGISWKEAILWRKLKRWDRYGKLQPSMQDLHGVGQCLSKEDSTGLTNTHHYAQLILQTLMTLLRVCSNHYLAS